MFIKYILINLIFYKFDKLTDSSVPKFNTNTIYL